MATLAAEIERLGATAKVLTARRAADTGSFWRTSQATRPAQWLAEISGTSEFMADQQLQTAERLDDCVATAAALRDGSLSLAQAQQVTKAAVVDPGAETRLLGVAETSGFRALREEQERTVAAVTDMDAARRKAHRERHLRTKVRGCDRSDHLQRHHTTRVADGGLTTYEVLGNACPDRHHLIHDKGYEIVVNDDGTWSLRAPARPPPDEAAA